MTAAPVAVAGPSSTAGRPTNLVVTRFTLAFAAVSAAASLLPLFAAGAFAAPPRGLDRGASLAWYGLSLACFFGCVAPAATARDSGRSLRPWATLYVFAGLFASVPAAVAAYVSGVAWTDLARLAAAPAALAGTSLFLRAAFGPAGGRAACALFFVLGVALPAVPLAARTFGGEPPFAAACELSPTWWTFRLATRRPAPDAAAWWAVAAATWIGALCVARFGRKPAAGAAAAVAAAAFAFAPAPQGPLDGVRIEAPAGPDARAGARTPLRVVKPAGALELRFATELRRLPAEATTVDLLVVLTPDERDVELRAGGAARRAPLPCATLPASTALAGVVTRPGGAVARAASETPVAGFAVRDLGDAAGLDAAALEGFDVLALEAAAYAALPAADVARFDRYAAEGGTLLLLGPRPAGVPAARLDGEGRRIFGGALAELDATAVRRRVPDATDPALRSVFLRPDWARVDLGRLATFLVLYHVAFLLAFLLPWRLDAHKSSNVYLVSVGFVLVVVVFGGRAALRSFFLRDNQVATQSFTAALFDADPSGAPRALVRQWRSFASMSGETRDLPLSAPGRTTVYRDRTRAPLPFSDDGPARLAGVFLDRFDAHVLLREDRLDPAPLAATEEPRVDGTVFRVAPTPGAPDPARLRFATPRRAWLWDGVGTAVEGASDGPWSFRFAAAVASAAPGSGANGPPVEVRAVVARSVPPRPGDLPVRRLVVTLDGAARLDDPSSYFNVEDRGAVLIFAVPASR